MRASHRQPHDLGREDPTDIETFAYSRGFDPLFLARFGIALADEGEIPLPGLWIRIPYPYYYGVWYNRYRALDPDYRPKYVAPKDSVPHLYNPLRLGPNADEVWLVEGEFDCLAAIALGVPAVGLPGADIWRKEWAPLFSEARLVIAMDPDQAGIRGAAQVAQSFRNAETFTVPAKDWNEWYLTDPEGAARMLEEWI